MRRVPINCARGLGKATRIWRLFPLVYIACAFFLFPIMLLGLSMCFTTGSSAMSVLGIILVIFLIVGIAYFIYWWRCNDGATKCYNRFVAKEKRRVTMKDLPETIDGIHADIVRIKEAIGMSDDIEEEDEEVQKLLSDDKTDDMASVEKKEGAMANDDVFPEVEEMEDPGKSLTA